MGTRSFAQVAPTAGQVALNAYIYGYGGHSLVTPHAALKQLWWTDDRIDSKVTRPFVVSKLRGEEREFLDRPLAFGEGLTDDTYMEWILERAKRLFLILSEIGVPDQIFGCIDDSWDDDDLPVSLENVENLELAYESNDALNKKFYDMQFVYLLRELKRGHHIDYGPKEHIPMDYVNSLPPAVSLQDWDRVHFPGRFEAIFMRRKFPLTDKESGQSYRDAFMRDIRKAKALDHEHISRTWASYTSEDSGYVLSDFVAEHTLRTYIDHRTPMQLLRVAPSERPRLMCEWMHCLADALAFLHHSGVAHTAIRPSNILIDHDNRICYADVGSLRTFQRGKKANQSEAYEYAAPEAQICREPSVMATSPPISSMGAFSKLRKMSSSTSSSSTGSSGSSSARSSSICTATSSPASPPLPKTTRSNSFSSITTAMFPISLSKSASGFRNFSRHIVTPSASSIASSVPPSPTSTRVFPRPTVLDPDSLRDLPLAAPEMSDIFSLACVFLDILTFMVKGRTTDFVKFRSTRHSDGALADGRSRHKTRLDTSFHGADPDRLYTWMQVLEEDGEKRQEPVFRAVSELLSLCRTMLTQNATLRPTAMQVRDRLQAILVGVGGVEKLCCAGRVWEDQDVAQMASPDLAPMTARDSMLSAAQQPRSTEIVNGSRCDSSYGQRTGFAEEGAEAPDVPRQRRQSSASSMTATVKLSMWRRAFTRSRTS